LNATKPSLAKLKRVSGTIRCEIAEVIPDLLSREPHFPNQIVDCTASQKTSPTTATNTIKFSASSIVIPDEEPTV
jgi:hypothetical protein